MSEVEPLDGPGGWSESLEPFGLKTFSLPGMGESGPRCGEWQPDSVCDECGELGLTTHSCGRRCCPNCWGKWAEEASVRATVRVQSFRHTQPKDYHRQVAHSIVSPAEGVVTTIAEYWEWCSKAADIAKEKGFRGCSVVPHPFRVTEEAQEEYEREDPDVGVWVWLRREKEDWSQHVYWSPHYHIVGLTSPDMDPAEEDDDGAVYHWKRSVEPMESLGDLDSHEDLYGLYRYLLSHTGYPSDSTKQVVRWYGALANNMFVEDASQEWQQEKPPERERERLEEKVREVAESYKDDESGGVGDAEEDIERCRVDGCEGEMIQVFDVPMYLETRDPPKEVRRRMLVARDWRLGNIDPPPGMQRPQSREQAVEAFGELVERYG
jgi:hypothetical protein